MDGSLIENKQEQYIEHSRAHVCIVPSVCTNSVRKRRLCAVMQ